MCLVLSAFNTNCISKLNCSVCLFLVLETARISLLYKLSLLAIKTRTMFIYAMRYVCGGDNKMKAIEMAIHN